MKVFAQAKAFVICHEYMLGSDKKSPYSKNDLYFLNGVIWISIAGELAKIC